MQEEIAVLIIEDEALWAESLRKNLSDFGFRVVGTPSGFESAVIALNRRDYDVVLLDIHINGASSGLELGSMITGLYKRPFIYITSNTDAGVIRHAVGARPAAYLTKPVHPASLFATIQVALLNDSDAASATQASDADACFFVKQGNRYKKLFWEDVISLSAEKNYTGLLNKADSCMYFIRSTLPRTLQYIIPSHLRSNFIQISRTEAVQLSYISEFSAQELRTPLRSHVVSEHYVQQIKDRLNFLA